MRQIQIDLKSEFIDILERIEGLPESLYFPVFIDTDKEESPFLCLGVSYDNDVENNVFNDKKFIGTLNGWIFDGEIEEKISDTVKGVIKENGLSFDLIPRDYLIELFLRLVLPNEIFEKLEKFIAETFEQFDIEVTFKC